jgi:hypothetical protein
VSGLFNQLGKRLADCSSLSRWLIELFRRECGANSRFMRGFTRSRHTPRRRGIQYAAAFRFHHQRRWNTGSSAEPVIGRRFAPTRRRMMTAADTLSRSRDTMRPSFAKTFAQKKEGVGNTGCPLHPQPVCEGGSTRSSPRLHRKSPGIPARNGFNGLCRALPGDEFVLSPSSAN